jgi:hypothetical protein
MRYRIVYEDLRGTAERRELVVEAADEGAAYDHALEQMTEEERLIEVARAQG